MNFRLSRRAVGVVRAHYHLVQVKGNQPILQKQCRSLESSGEVIGENIEYDKANGRMTVRHASVFSMNSLTVTFDKL